MRDVDLMAEELRAAQRDGVACLVDAGLEGSGMDLEFIRAAAKKSGLPVVKGAGFYVEPFYPKDIAGMSEEQLVRALDASGRNAIPPACSAKSAPGTKSRRSSARCFAPWAKRTWRRTCRSSRTPAFRVSRRSSSSTSSRTPASIRSASRSAISAISTDPNVYVHKTLCRRGAFIGFDRQGGRGDAPVVPLVMALLNAGFADHVLISGDASRSYGKPLTAFLPQLKAAGADDATLRRITVDNPRRFLAFVPKKPRKS